jgi:hypothetical protein
MDFYLKYLNLHKIHFLQLQRLVRGYWILGSVYFTLKLKFR